MPTYVATRDFSKHLTDYALEEKDNLYFFVGNHVPNSNIIPEDVVDTPNSRREIFHHMIMGKKVAPGDVARTIRRNVWVPNTVYAQYDDLKTFTDDSPFYVTVDEGQFLHVWKCLVAPKENYVTGFAGVPSTYRPNFSHVSGGNTAVYRTPDGYEWKYMYSLTSNDDRKFGTPDYIPVYDNTVVQEQAVPGCIDVIIVEGPGYKYNNYFHGQFLTEHITIGGNTTLYQVSNNQLKLTNSYYNGTLIYITSGIGEGQYRTVANSFSNTSGTYLVVQSPFAILPQNGDTYEVYPEVKITGSGNQTENCVARALVNAEFGNAVHRVEILNRGAEYDYDVIANTQSHPVVGATPTELRVVLPPPGGHGTNPAVELGSRSIVYSVYLSNTEANTLLTSNDFRQFGIIKNPLFANVLIQANTLLGAYLLDEKVLKVDLTRIELNGSMSTLSNELTCNGALFTNQLAQDDYVYLETVFDQQLVQVASISNNESVSLAQNGHFTASDITIYKAVVEEVGRVTAANGSHITITDTLGNFQNQDVLIGEVSNAKLEVNAVFRSGIAKYFNTFVQLSRYVGTPVSGTFRRDETVIQGNTQSNAILHSSVVDGGSLALFVSHAKGDWHNGPVVGLESGARAELTELNDPELRFNTGEVLYFENISPITRTDDSVEIFSIVFEI